VKAEPPPAPVEPAPNPVKEAVAATPKQVEPEPEPIRTTAANRKVTSRPARAAAPVKTASIPEPVRIEEEIPVEAAAVVVTASAGQPPELEELSQPEAKKSVFGLIDSKRKEMTQRVSTLVKTTQQEAQSKVYGLLKSNQYDAALEAANDCAESHPDMPECQLMLGAVHAKLNHPKESTRHYEAFLKLAPEDHPRRARVIQLLRKGGSGATTPVD
jgi:eukaryotic-like serine/threonine-protein kinase